METQSSSLLGERPGEPSGEDPSPETGAETDPKSWKLRMKPFQSVSPDSATLLESTP
jgi:hypothetical protein